MVVSEPTAACPPEEAVLDFITGRLPPERRAAIEQHLSQCGDCRMLVQVTRDSGDWVPELARAIHRRAPLAPETVLADRYRIINFIGRGGMGAVYEAEDRELGKRIALKALNDDLAEDPRMISRVKREVQLAHRVTHPNVCRIFDIGWHRPASPAARPLCFLTMELLRGETLRQRLQRCGRFTPAEALPIVSQLAAGLAAAHAAEVIHRDFKSDNVLLVEEPGPLRVVVTDFGLARAVQEGDSGLSSAGTLIGTAAYMAPEQALADPITSAADVYALGIVMFEMLTGQLPFSGATPFATAVARLQRPAPSPRTLVPELDAAWDETILKCLARRPEDRFANAAEIPPALSSPPTARAPLPPGPRRAPKIAGAALLVAAAAVSTVRLTQPRAPRALTTAAVPLAAVAPPPAPAPPPAFAAAPPKRATLQVHADSEDALIKIDDRAITAPGGNVQIEVDPALRHLLLVTAPGRRPWSKSVIVTPGAVLDIPVRLRRRAALRAPQPIGNNVVDPYEEAP
jgi:hypothetical protein